MLKVLQQSYFITLHYTSQQRQGPHINEMKSEFLWDNLWSVFEDLNISMIMVPHQSVKRVGLSPLVNMMRARPPTPTELEKREGLS
jgi:hypothetical protein